MTLEVVGLGVFEPGEVMTIDDEAKVKNYLDTGYFDEVKERKKKPKYKSKIKKSKKKGDEL